MDGYDFVDQFLTCGAGDSVRDKYSAHDGCNNVRLHLHHRLVDTLGRMYQRDNIKSGMITPASSKGAFRVFGALLGR